MSSFWTGRHRIVDRRRLARMHGLRTASGGVGALAAYGHMRWTCALPVRTLAAHCFEAGCDDPSDPRRPLTASAFDPPPNPTRSRLFLSWPGFRHGTALDDAVVAFDRSFRFLMSLRAPACGMRIPILDFSPLRPACSSRIPGTTAAARRTDRPIEAGRHAHRDRTAIMPAIAACPAPQPHHAIAVECRTRNESCRRMTPSSNDH